MCGGPGVASLTTRAGPRRSAVVLGIARSASPAKAMAVLAAPEPAKPITSEVWDTRASLTPNTPAQRAGAVTPVPALDSPAPAGIVRVSHSGNYPGAGTL